MATARYAALSPPITDTAGELILVSQETRPADRSLDMVGTVTGRVTDANTLRPIAAAQISIDAIGIGTIVNDD